MPSLRFKPLHCSCAPPPPLLSNNSRNTSCSNTHPTNQPINQPTNQPTNQSINQYRQSTKRSEFSSTTALHRHHNNNNINNNNINNNKQQQQQTTNKQTTSCFGKCASRKIAARQSFLGKATIASEKGKWTTTHVPIPFPQKNTAKQSRQHSTMAPAKQGNKAAKRSNKAKVWSWWCLVCAVLRSLLFSFLFLDRLVQPSCVAGKARAFGGGACERRGGKPSRPTRRTQLVLQRHHLLDSSKILPSSS